MSFAAGVERFGQGRLSSERTDVRWSVRFFDGHSHNGAARTSYRSRPRERPQPRIEAAFRLLLSTMMRVLEARFRPETESPFLIVGHLVWLGQPAEETPIVHPAPALLRQGSSV